MENRDKECVCNSSFQSPTSLLGASESTSAPFASEWLLLRSATLNYLGCWCLVQWCFWQCIFFGTQSINHQESSLSITQLNLKPGGTRRGLCTCRHFVCILGPFIPTRPPRNWELLIPKSFKIQENLIHVGLS